MGGQLLASESNGAHLVVIYIEKAIQHDTNSLVKLINGTNAPLRQHQRSVLQRQLSSSYDTSLVIAAVNPTPLNPLPVV